MNLVLGTLELTTIGGVGTYLVTVAEQLEGMGHGVTILADETGEMGAIAGERGLRVVSEPADLPDDCDAVYAQDAPTAYALAERYREVPQAFCAHAPDHDRWLVPQLPGVTSATVALHERAVRHVRSLGHVPEVVRLRQPVDIRRFSPRGTIGASPRRALALGNYTSGNRLELIRRACEEVGIELVQRGLQGGGFTSSPEAEINDSDIVVGKARVIVEALSCGRAAYVYDHSGGDGWVTTDRYAQLEADNFEGIADSRPVDAARLGEDLLAYRADMGPTNRDLAVAHHGARPHAHALIELFGRLRPRSEPEVAPLDELSRLTRVQWQADARALGFEHEARLLRVELQRRNQDQVELQGETERAQRQAAEAEQRAAAAEHEATQAQQALATLEAEAAEFRATRPAPGNGGVGNGGVEIAVVMPLEDPRGDIVEHLRTWTHGQALSRERYQLVLAANGDHPEFERQVAELLAPQDQLVSAPQGSLIGLYDAAARAAQGRVLVITEAHCRAEPGCLAAVADAFAGDPDLDAATFQHLQSASTSVGKLTERWFTDVFEAWDRAGWTRLNLTGAAIRADAYARAGGLDPRLELYATSFMSARLDQQGARFAHIDAAAVTHELEEGMRESLEMSRSFARGECVMRGEQDVEFCESYFGPAGLWDRRLAYRPEVARPMVAALVSAARRSPRDAAWLVRELVARLPALVAGTRPRLAWERAAGGWRQAMAASPLFTAESRWRSYFAAQERAVRAVQLSQSAEQNGLPPSLGTSDGALGAERLGGVVVGAHGLEVQQGRRFRWTEPVAMLRLDPPPEGAVLRVETGGLRGAPLDYLQGIHAGGMRLAPDLISGDGETLEARLPAEFARGAARHGIVLLCNPLVPSRTGSSDRRRLGMPIMELAISAS